jgi:hypothetical protein
MPLIAWTDFSWEAFATLTTGAMAVAGAVWVGLRQTTISDRQTKILHSQAKVAELTLRHELFERRLKVYQMVEGFLAFIMRTATFPEEQMFDLPRAMAQSKFVFRPEVHDNIQEIWKRSLTFRTLKVTMQTTFDAEGHYGEGNPQREEDHLEWFYDRLRSLPDVFGEEMKLS